MLDKKEISAILESFEKEELEQNPLDLTSDYEGLVDEKMSEDQIKKADKLKPEVSKAIAAAMRSLSRWKDDLPTDAKKALALLAKLATGKYPYPAPYKKSIEGEESESSMEKAGAKVSKYTGNEIAKAIKLLQAILPDGFMKELEEEAKEDDALTMLQKIHDHLVKKEDESKDDSGKENESGRYEGQKEKENSQGSGQSPDDKIVKMLEKISTRLETVEKQSGVKKSIESDGSEEGEESKNSGNEDLYPSIAID